MRMSLKIFPFILIAGWCIILSGACKSSSSSLNDNIVEVITDVDTNDEEDNEYVDTSDNAIEDNEVNADYDYDDTSATIDENAEDEDDSSDAFKDVEEEQVCAIQPSSAPQQKILPGALIIGTKKGGTTALLEFLNIHSQIKRTKNEMHFYDKHFSRGLNWYIEKMPAVTSDQVAMEKTPGYFHTPGVARKIWSVKNDSKLILIVRHPVSRLISDYNQFRSYHQKKGEDYPRIEDLVINKNGRIDNKYPPLVRSIYHLHMSRWLQVFPREQIYVVDGDQFISSPWLELVNLEKFLGLEPELSQENFYFNSSKGFYCGRQEVKMAESDWSCVRRKCLSGSKGRAKPQVSEAFITQLTHFFRSHNQKFYNLVGRTFKWDSEP